MNVSLPSEQERFVCAQVEAGRFRTASEVIREGLRLLEEADHRRLVEKWLYEGLQDEERDHLPEPLRQKVQSHFQSLIEAGVEDLSAGRTADGPEAMARLRKALEARR